MSKALKTEGSEWASSELKTSRSEDQVSKALKTEVLMNVSRFQNLQLRRSRANGTLSLKILNLVFFFHKSTRKYTSLTHSTTNLQALARCHFQAAKSTVPLGIRQKLLSISQQSTLLCPSIKGNL